MQPDIKTLSQYRMNRAKEDLEAAAGNHEAGKLQSGTFWSIDETSFIRYDKQSNIYIFMCLRAAKMYQDLRKERKMYVKHCESGAFSKLNS